MLIAACPFSVSTKWGIGGVPQQAGLYGILGFETK